MPNVSTTSTGFGKNTVATLLKYNFNYIRRKRKFIFTSLIRHVRLANIALIKKAKQVVPELNE